MKSIFSAFKKGLQKTSTSLSRGIKGVFTDSKTWTEDDYEMLEASLIGADFGVQISMNIVESVRDKYERGLISTSEDILKAANDEVLGILGEEPSDLELKPNQLNVILFVGVNGSGKTTTIGKLAQKWKSEGKKVVLAACDTFRAAAAEQLKLWGERTGCYVVSS
jgi:fused signal recognition particle receptor